MASKPHVELIRSARLAQRASYAYAAVATDSLALVFTAGACPLDTSGETVAAGDVAARAEQVMENLQIALEAAGARLADVVKTTVFVASTEQKDLLAAWEVVSRRFGDHAASTLPGVATIGYRNQLVEVEAVAAFRTSAE
jgi:enamine deaminase RidA (YjgF/YER057c/UK114 family)